MSKHALVPGKTVDTITVRGRTNQPCEISITTGERGIVLWLPTGEILRIDIASVDQLVNRLLVHAKAVSGWPS